MQISPKLGGRALATTSVPSLSNSCHLLINDPTNHHTFLIDTGATVSVLPPTDTDKKFPQLHFYLTAANGSQIRTYGRRSLTLNLGLRRSLPWIFLVAEVQKPIIGANFFHHFNFSIDFKKKALVDNTTDLSISGLLVHSTSPTPSLPPPSNFSYELTALLDEFPQLP